MEHTLAAIDEAGLEPQCADAEVGCMHGCRHDILSHHRVGQGRDQSPGRKPVLAGRGIVRYPAVLQQRIADIPHLGQTPVLAREQWLLRVQQQ